MSTIAKTAAKPITKKQARDLTECIKVAAALTWDLIVKAYNERAWSALGYGSWDDYCDAELSGTRLRLPREERSEVVSSLRDSGMSLRAIQSATGVSRPTIIKDLADAQVVNSLPPEAPGGVTDSTPGQTDRVAAALERARQGTAPATIAAPATITGMDGKTYTKPKPKPIVVEPDVEATVAVREEEAMRVAARAVELSAWGKACDGLLAALSFAASSAPPENTDRYPVVGTFIERYQTLGNHINTWRTPEPIVVDVAEHQDDGKTAKLRTWCGGRSHEFDNWDAVYAAINANIAGVSTMIGTVGSKCYRTRSDVKIPVDEADFMAEQLKDLQAALMVLLDNRPGGDRR